MLLSQVKKVKNENLKNGFKVKKSKVRKIKVIKKIKIKGRNEFMKEVKKNKKIINFSKVTYLFGICYFVFYNFYYCNIICSKYIFYK